MGNDQSISRYVFSLFKTVEYTEGGANTKKTKTRPRETQMVVAPNPKEQKKGVRKRMRIREEKHPSPPEPKIRSKGFKKNVKPPPQVSNLDDQTEEEKTEKIPPSSELNERVEKATKRTDKLEKALPRTLKNRVSWSADSLS